MLNKLKAKVKENCTKEKLVEAGDNLRKSVTNTVIDVITGSAMLSVRKAVKRAISG